MDFCFGEVECLVFCGCFFCRLPEIQWCVLRTPCNQDERILALNLGLTEFITHTQVSGPRM